jgi:hypothetical protein
MANTELKDQEVWLDYLEEWRETIGRRYNKRIQR